MLKKSLFVILIIILFGINNIFAEVWQYDFGDGSDSALTSGASTTFLPVPPSGTTRGRIGTGGGGLYLTNPGTDLGDGVEAQLNAATGTSTNKFGIYDWADTTQIGYLKFKIRTTSTGNGNLAIAVGKNTIITDNNGYTSQYNNSLTVFWITYTSGNISAVTRRSSGSNQSITNHEFSKDTNQNVEIYFNNSNTQVSYKRNNTTYNLNAQTWDLWIDDNKKSTDGGWPKAGTLANTEKISGFAFFAESSTGNAAWLYIDDIEYSNELPTDAPAQPNKPNITFPVATDTSHDTNSAIIIVSGTATAGDTIHLYIGPEEKSTITNITSTNWSFTIGIDTGLKINDTTIIKIAASNNTGIYSDTAQITIFVDTAAPVMIGSQLVTGNTEFLELRPTIQFAQFIDSSTITHYEIYYDTGTNFSNYQYSVSSTNSFTPSADLTYDTWYFRVSAVDKFNQKSDSAAFIAEILITPPAATKPTILKPTIRPNFVLLFPAVKIQGYADAGDTILLYSNDILISSKPAASDTFWSFIIDTSAALIINDTVRIKIYAINTEGRTSLPAELDIFVYQPLTRTENFSNLPSSSSSSYLSRTWNGVGGQWTAEGARTDQTLNGKAICFGNSGTRKVTSPQFNDGISYLSFLYSRAFTATTARTLEIYINNELIDTIAVSPTSNDVQTYTKNLNINGAVKIEIQSTGLSQVKLDDITWNANYDPRPAKPIITAPISNTDTYYTNSNNFILTGAAQTNYKIYLYQNSEYISNTVADNNTFQFNITGIPDAPPSKIELILENEYNEESDTTILNIIIDKIPPVLTADRLLTKTKYNSQQPMITFNTFTDNNTIAYYKIYLDTNINFTNYIYETAPTTTYIPTMNLTYDTWYIKIRAVDIAGNESTDYTDTFITKETVLQPIADIKNVDNNGIPLYLGDEVIVEGIVTLGTNRISRANNQVFIQDHSAAGICLFKANDTSYVFTEGDSVRVRGIVGNYNGLTTIEFTQVELLAINQSLPEPLDITTNQLATTGEIFEGKRIKITNAKITSGSFPSSGINANLTINDGTGNAAWRIEGVSDISGKLTPGCSITVVGIVSQYVTSSPFTSGHQLVLRSYDDIVFETNVLPQYYNSALSKRGEELLRSLNQIIRGHKKISYDSLWRAYYFTDVRAENKVWDIYSDYGFGEGGAYNYTLGIDQDTGQPAPGEGYSYNREHTFSQNWFNNLDNIDIYSDIFHIYPTDKYVNNKRGHLPMGKVDNATETFTNGSKIGPNVYPGYDGSVFEIIDAYKGDIARTYFYIVARYLGEDTGWNNTPMFDGSKIKDWAKKLLIEWHTLDSVSEKEINRNNEIYKIQGNRNPFIDYPDFVYAIWGYGYDTAAHNVNNETTIIADSFQMIIPANIVTDTNYLNLKIMDFYNFPNSPENHFQLTDKLYSVTFENYDTKLLSKNVEIKIYYDESKLPFAANENEITVFWYNADNDSYVKLDTQYYSINTTNNLVTINVNYVGLFGVFIKEKIVPIINIKTVNNSGVALHLNKKVTVEGIATVSSGIYHATQNKVFIQDTTAAVMIYQSTQSTNIPEGAKVRVTGTISQYYGLLQLENPQITIIDTGNVQPEPIILTLSELSANGELYEGQLVKIERVKIVSGQFPTQPNYWQNLTINDGTDNFTLRIESTNPDIWDKPTPTKEFNVIGIVNQYDGSSPYTSGYQLIPRYYADFEFTLSQGIYSITTATETSITIGGYELYIPANTVSKPTFQIKIEKLFALPAMTQELKIVNPVYHIITDSSIGNLNENIRQIIGYDTSLLPYGADENILKLYKYDINSDTFILIDSNLYQINTAQKKIIISSDTFEIYAIFAEYPMTNIREIRQIDNNGTPLLIGKSVMIEGIVTHITGSNNREVYIQQDTSAAIALDYSEFNYAIGDKIRVTGTIGVFRGLMQIQNATLKLISNNNSLPEPITLTIDELLKNAEYYEGMLIAVENLKIVSGSFPTINSSANVYVNDRTTSNDLNLRIESYTDIDGKQTPTIKFIAVGVLSQYASATAPYSGGYQLKPRSYSDIKFYKELGNYEISKNNETKIELPQLKIIIPPNAMANDTIISIKEEFYFDTLPSAYKPVGSVYKFNVIGFDSYTFDTMLEIELRYDRADLPIGAKEYEIRPYYYNPINPAASHFLGNDSFIIDAQNKKIKIFTNHFSYYMLLAPVTTVINIADAKIDLNNDEILDLKERYITIQGLVTAGFGVFDNTKLNIFVEDTTTNAAINIYHDTATDTPAYTGDYIRVTGKLWQTNGLSQIIEPIITIIDNGLPTTQATKINAAQFKSNPEAYECRLVEILVEDTYSLNTYSSDNIWRVSESGNEFYLYIDNNAGISYTAMPYQKTLVKGIVYQNNTSALRNNYSEYFIMPRSNIDFSDMFASGVPSSSNYNARIINRAFAPKLNQTLEIEYTAGLNTPLEIKIFNVQGRLIKDLYNGIVSGSGKILWDGKKNTGAIAEIGIYIAYINLNGQKYSIPISVAVPLR